MLRLESKNRIPKHQKNVFLKEGSFSLKKDVIAQEKIRAANDNLKIQISKI